MLSEHTLEGMLEGYLLTGRHGFLSTYEAFAHVIDSMFNQHAKWLSICNQLPWRQNVASLNLLITSTVWRQDHNGFTHQDPGFLDVVVNKRAEVTRIYLPPDVNSLLSVADHCLRSENYINVIVSDKKPHLQFLTMDEAITHCTRGVSIWGPASNDQGVEPDVVMACAGDIPTQETLAATALLRNEFPDLKIRFVNVVDLFKLQSDTEHPHGLSDRDFDSLFTADKPIVFNFHGYPWLIHRLAYRRTNHKNLHVRGYKERGNINTPMELAINNESDRFTLAIDVIDRVPKLKTTGAHGPAQRTALEVLAANEVETLIQESDGVTPTPVISRAILVYNRNRKMNLADGIVVTPSHNPPEDGGFKYNPPNGGPADTVTTSWIENRANDLLRAANVSVKRIPVERALKAATTHEEDFIHSYVNDLSNIVDMEAIRAAGLSLAVDPLGGAGLPYWEPINAAYKLNIEIVNPVIDPRFSFMTVDHDGKIRMDPSSPYAMAGLVKLKDQYRVAFANDVDADRHGIVTRSGLMNPNHYLSVAIQYLLTHRPEWRTDAAVGKTLVSSQMIDRVVQNLGRRLWETPVGFKWFVPGLIDGSVCFGGEESAGASFLRRDGTVWTTDKDGLIMDLLAAEITARTDRDPGEHFSDLVSEFGRPFYTRIDQPASPEQRAKLGKLAPEAVNASTLAGEPITAKLTSAPGNGASIGGLKVVANSGWFAARPSGTENIYKIYAESFRDQAHLEAIVSEAQEIVHHALTNSGKS